MVHSFALGFILISQCFQAVTATVATVQKAICCYQIPSGKLITYWKLYMETHHQHMENIGN